MTNPSISGLDSSGYTTENVLKEAPRTYTNRGSHSTHQTSTIQRLRTRIIGDIPLDSAYLILQDQSETRRQ